MPSLRWRVISHQPTTVDETRATSRISPIAIERLTASETRSGEGASSIARYFRSLATESRHSQKEGVSESLIALISMV